MPRLSFWNKKKQNDFRFFDRTIGEMILTEVEEDDFDELFESYDEEIEDEFTIFMEKVDRYLLINYNRESKHFDKYLWEEAWKEEKFPNEAADEAVIFEG